ncbi:MAG: magnesium transporter, partial [Lachnospiraceae bacterium]|nr:magnesium transporter [Lachnospiraceae bacterium]
MEEIRGLEEVKALLETKQYTRLRQRMEEANSADIATVMEEFEESELLKIFRILPKNMAADVFSYLEVDKQQFIITSLSEKDAAGIIDYLMADDATDL